MAQPEEFAARIAALEQRATQTEKLLAEKIPGFEGVAGRVDELSAAAVEFNRRLSRAESTLAALVAAAPPAPVERVEAVESALSLVTGRVEALEATRARTGLSGRLTGIEDTLRQLVEQGNTGGEPA